jgi:hypothetical protein
MQVNYDQTLIMVLLLLEQLQKSPKNLFISKEKKIDYHNLCLLIVDFDVKPIPQLPN